MGESATHRTGSFNGYQKFAVALLSFLQFTVILDFMTLSPLSAILIPGLDITPRQFGLAVSAYAFSAGISGFVASGFSDRFDRKKFLLSFYVGFVVGTFACSIASSYPSLLIARVITGLSGGVISSIVLAIVADLFPFEMRGRVMGFVQTAYGASQVLGIPLGLLLSNRWGWHAPFWLILGASIVVGGIIKLYLRPIDAHLRLRPDRSAFHHLFETVSTPRHLLAFATMAFLATGSFMLMPFMSAFNVNNLGIAIANLPLVYFAGGISAMLCGPFVGRASDGFGKFRVFLFGSLLTIVAILVYTNLGITPLSRVILVSTVLFVGVTSRIVPSQALISAVPAPANRGAFMSVNSSVQQLSGGIAAILAGWIVVERKGGVLDHFNWLGYVVSAAFLVTMVMMYVVNKQVSGAPRMSLPTRHSDPLKKNT